MRTYSAVVVLAPGIRRNTSGPLQFSDDLNLSFSYEVVGDPFEFRFKAAAKLYEIEATQRFLLVGGKVDGEEGVPKGAVMQHRLSTEYGIPVGALTPLVSASNTQGNARAVKEYLQQDSKIDVEEIGVLTNFYHLSRATRMFMEEVKLRLIPICAEGFILDDEFDNIRKFYRDEALGYIVGDLETDRCEIRGLLALESAETYDSQEK